MQQAEALDGVAPLARDRHDRCRLRVLHLTAGRAFGGVERMLLALHAAARHAPTLEQDFACIYRGQLHEALRASGATVHHIGAARAARPWTVLKALAQLARLRREHGYDVVVCHDVWAQVLFARALRLGGGRVVSWLHSLPTAGAWETQLIPFSLPDAVVFNSEFTRSAWQARYSRVRSAVIHPPVAAAGDREVRARTRLQLGAGPGDVVIAFVARFDRMKGHLLLLDALSRLERPGVITWIVGGPQSAGEQLYRDQVVAHAERLGLASRVKFLGMRDDVYDVLAGADLYCQPNLESESFGISYTEALAAGLPVVATGIGGALEIVDESCGELVPRDAASLAASLSKLIADPGRRQKLAAAGPARALELCEPARRLAEFSALLSQLIPVATRPGSADTATSHARDAGRVPTSSVAAPRFSVLVPSLARPEHLRRCLQALAKQTLAPLQIVVGTRDDDADTHALLDSLGPIGVPVTRATTGAHGVVASMNAALPLCRGELIAITDDDAEPELDWLARLHELFEDPRVAAVGGRDVQAEACRRREHVGRVQWFGRLIGNHHLGIGGARQVDYVKGVNCAFRATLLRTIGFDARLLGGGAEQGWELALCLPLRRDGWLIVYDSQIVVKHHVAARAGPAPDLLHRGGFGRRAQSDATHNETLVLLEHQSPFARATFLVWSLAIGTWHAPGLLQLARLYVQRDPYSLARFVFTVHGRLRGVRSWHHALRARPTSPEAA